MAGRREGAGVRTGRGARAPYPAHWEADIALRDGSAAHLRPITPADAERLQRFHVAQSERSRYFRFLAPMPRLSEKDLRRFTTVDHRDRVAFVVLQGEEIIAVGRYDRVADGEAEVAFNVADHRQGLGIGSMLLEHLAAAARERGITTFTAEVHPSNSAMLRVFADAGFDVRRTLDDGVLLVEFPISPTERSRAVIAEREHRAESRAMERLLHPRSVLVVGVSTRMETAGSHMIRSLERSGWNGTVHIVSRDLFEYHGHTVHGRIEDVPGPVDLAVLAVHPRRVIDAIDSCASIGVKGLLVPTEVYTGDEADGGALQRSVIARARRHGMRVMGPGSLGFLRVGTDDPVSLSLATRTPRPGPVALAAQSAALSAQLLAAADARGTGVHEFVSVGARADVSLNDCLQHWQDDEAISVIGLGIESFGNPRKFMRLARRITRERPLVIMRPPGTAAEHAHRHLTRRVRLGRRGLDQVLGSAGVVRTETPGQLMNVVDAIARLGLPRGPRVGLIANSPALAETLRASVEGEGIDTIAEARTVPLASDRTMLSRAVVSTAARGGVDLLIGAFLDPLDGDLAGLLRTASDVARHSEVPLVLCIISDHERFSALQQEVRADPLLPPVHAEPGEAARTAAGLLAARRAVGASQAVPERFEVDVDSARRIIRAALLEAGTDPDTVERAPVGAPREEAPGIELDPDRARALLACYGLEVTPSRLASTAEEAVRAARELGYPAVLKSSAESLRHRADLGAVRLDIVDDAQMRRAHREMSEQLGDRAPLLVQPQVRAGVPVVMRTEEDPALGPVLTVSLAGDATDLLGDTASAIPPLAREAAHQLLTTPVSARRLAGGNGVPPADMDALAEVVMRLGQLCDDHPDIRRCTLHPVLAAPDGARIVDARLVLAPAPNRMEGLRRVLIGSGGL